MVCYVQSYPAFRPYSRVLNSSEVRVSTWPLNSPEIRYAFSFATSFIVELSDRTPVVATECRPLKMFSDKLQTYT